MSFWEVKPTNAPHDDETVSRAVGALGVAHEIYV